MNKNHYLIVTLIIILFYLVFYSIKSDNYIKEKQRILKSSLSRLDSKNETICKLESKVDSLNFINELDFKRDITNSINKLDSGTKLNTLLIDKINKQCSALVKKDNYILRLLSINMDSVYSDLFSLKHAMNELDYTNQVIAFKMSTIDTFLANNTIKILDTISIKPPFNSALTYTKDSVYTYRDTIYKVMTDYIFVEGAYRVVGEQFRFFNKKYYKLVSFQSINKKVKKRILNFSDTISDESKIKSVDIVLNQKFMMQVPSSKYCGRIKIYISKQDSTGKFMDTRSYGYLNKPETILNFRPKEKGIYGIHFKNRCNLMPDTIKFEYLEEIEGYEYEDFEYRWHYPKMEKYDNSDSM
jgi:hypothetical protein